jgi:energy-coupling factor transporter ATP-binding protein EcfA2
MYSQHFGLDRTPFRITPDPAFFFPGGNRGAVLDALIYAISRGEGIVKVVGEVGSGKTMLCRMLERELPEHCEIIYLANPRLAPDEILHAIAVELELPVAATATRLDVMRALHEHLVGRHAANRRVVMFVEEAQGMPLATLARRGGGRRIRLCCRTCETSAKEIAVESSCCRCARARACHRSAPSSTSPNWRCTRSEEKLLQIVLFGTRCTRSGS